MSVDIVVLLLGLAAGGAVVWFVTRRQRSGGVAAAPDQFSALERHVTERLDRVTADINRRLKDNVEAINESKSFLAQQVGASQRSIQTVSAALGRLTEVASSLSEQTKEISNFQQLLKNPKIRGSFGEILLGNLLSEVLPSDRYALQQPIRTTGEIADAIIKLQDGYIVAIDAKFPLANYEAYKQAEDPAQKKSLRTLFMRDVKKHVADISRKYIAPSDRTLDFAFMYIPMEGVYYETIMRDEGGDVLWDFCLASHVVPVSPNSFLAYLHTVLIGLRGMKIEQQAKEILEHLNQVRRDFGRFAEDFTTVGKHLVNAKNRFDDSARSLDRFAARLDQLEGEDTAPLLAEPAAEHAEEE